MKKKTSEVEWRTDLNDTQQKIIKLLSEDHQLSAVKLAEKIGVVSRNIENNIKKLKEYGILIGHGSPKNGYWEIIDKDLRKSILHFPYWKIHILFLRYHHRQSCPTLQ